MKYNNQWLHLTIHTSRFRPAILIGMVDLGSLSDKEILGPCLELTSLHIILNCNGSVHSYSYLSCWIYVGV